MIHSPMFVRIKVKFEYPLVKTDIAVEHGHRKFVSFPVRIGDLNQSFLSVRLPEGRSGIGDCLRPLVVHRFGSPERIKNTKTS